ncbi:MobF family relaxase [Vibrio cyclitrophicus]
MLTVHPINSLKYYLEDDYYLDSAGPDGIWIGKASIYFNLMDKRIGDEYHSIMNGLSPVDATPLCTKINKNRRTGWDLTFSAPKSVSTVWAITDPFLRSQISGAQLTAVKRAISFLEEQAAYTRRGKGGRIRESVMGLIVATFEHDTSRSLDFSLHTHALVSNIAPREDGSWGSLLSREMYFWQKAVGAVYRAELAYQLKNLGFGVEPDGESFRLACIPKVVEQHFSKRTSDIEKRLNETSAISSASKIGNKIKVISRQSKLKIERSQLLDRWQNELKELGMTREFIERNRSLQVEDIDLPEVGEILDFLTDKTAIFRKQDLYQRVTVKLQWLCLPVEEITDYMNLVMVDDELVSLGVNDKGNVIYSTKQMIRLEKELLENTAWLSKQQSRSLPQAVIEQAITNQEELVGYHLTEEQKVALFNVCCFGDFSILQGSAGAGKSSVMSVLHQAYCNSGMRVLGAAVAKKAADNLTSESRIPSFTIAKLISDYKVGINHFSKADVLVIDEAGQVGTKQLREVVAFSAKHSVKIVLVGEDKQLDAIEHGGCLRFLSSKLGCSRIERIQRQKSKWARTAVMQLRDGKASHAIKVFDQKGLLHFEASSEQAKDKMIHEWNDYRRNNPDKASLLLAHRWEDVNQLSARMKAALQSEGSVSKGEVELDCIVSKHQCKYKFSEGDRVKFCQNDYRLGVSNGTFGKITKLTTSEHETRFQIVTDDGRCVHISPSNYKAENGRFPLALGYALTVYASQGTTIGGNVYVYWTAGMDRANTYVAGSRHKDLCHWFINEKELDMLSEIDAFHQNSIAQQRLVTLSKCMSADRNTIMAIEHLERLNSCQLHNGQAQAQEFE